MAGRTLRGMHRTADYKGGKALKSCHTEFVHIYGAAFFSYKGKISYGIFPFSLYIYRTKNKYTKTDYYVTAKTIAHSDDGCYCSMLFASCCLLSERDCATECNPAACTG